MALSEQTKQYMAQHCCIDLTGKTALITGANSGVGYKTAETLLYLGAAVILACRNPSRAEAARARLLADHPSATVSVMQLDLADFSSIEAFAAALPDVDVFVNNAGVLHRPQERTREGFEMVMGTNYLGVYRLGQLVLPRLRDCGHDVFYINTISIIHKLARVDFDRFYSSRGSYARSKLCLARYSHHLADIYRGTNVHIYMNHPGMAVTSIAVHVFGPLYRLARFAPVNSAEKSALSVAWLLSNSVPEGSVVGPNKGFGGWGYPERNRICRRATREIEPLIAFTEKELANTHP